MPHCARTVAVLQEVRRSYEKTPDYDRRKTVDENWEAMVDQADRCIKLLVREVKRLDEENSVFRSMLRLPASGGRTVECEGELFFDPHYEDARDDAAVRRVIASLDPDRAKVRETGDAIGTALGSFADWLEAH